MFINYGNLTRKSSLNVNFVSMNHMREKAKKKSITRMTCVEMKLYLKEKIFEDLLQGKQHSICKVWLGLLRPLFTHQAANGKQVSVSETM